MVLPTKYPSTIAYIPDNANAIIDGITYLKNNDLVGKIKGFITSSITNEKSLYGLEIYNINHVTIKENEIIILAVSGKSQMDILCNMSQELLQRTMVITDDIRQGLK